MSARTVCVHVYACILLCELPMHTNLSGITISRVDQKCLAFKLSCDPVQQKINLFNLLCCTCKEHVQLSLSTDEGIFKGNERLRWLQNIFLAMLCTVIRGKMNLVTHCVQIYMTTMTHF